MRICSVEGCGSSKIHARELCTYHYNRARADGSMEIIQPHNGIRRVCTIEGCDGTHIARGWCWTHYHNWQRLGTPFPLTDEERHVRHVEGGKKARAAMTPEQRSAAVTKGNLEKARRKREGLT